MQVSKIEIYERDVISDKPFTIVFKYGNFTKVRTFENKMERDRAFNALLIAFNLTIISKV